MIKAPVLRNPQLDGSAFTWESGPVGILLCHGFTATTTEVRLLAQSLHAHGYSVAAPLIAGHGTTPEDCNRQTWQDWLASADQAYRQLSSSCQVIIVGGESMGALLALQLANQYPSVAAVLCYAPALVLKRHQAETFLLSLLIPFITSIPKPLPGDDNLWKGYAVQPLRGVRELLRLQEATYPILPHIHQPILLIQGRLDPTIHPQSPAIIYNRVASPLKELYWLENSAHCIILDKEHDMAASLTLDFLDRILAR